MNHGSRLKDYYKVLGVAPEAPAEEIRAAYRRLARKHHPDRSDAPGAEERFKEVGEAWDVLKDDQRRQAYDRLRAGGSIPGFDSAASGFGGDGAIDLGALFEQLFGGFAARSQGGAGARPGPAPGRRPRRSPPPKRGADRRATLTIDLEAAHRGGSESVSVGGRTLTVTIPAGATDGQKLRLKGQGDAGGGGAGDLLLELRHRSHPVFRADGRNLHRRLDVPVPDAALGGRLPVDTLDGRLELTVPAGARSGQKLRLRGRGLPGSPPGDLFIELMIQLPDGDAELLRPIYESLREPSGDG